MLFWLGLVAGLIIGWVIEWIIDWNFWRNTVYVSVEQEARTRKELEATRREITKLQAQIDNRSTSLAPISGQTPANRVADPLEEIQGIGPVFAQKLNQAGIYTFLQLSQLTPERVLEIIQPESWQRIDAQAWLTQAHTLSQKGKA